MRPLSVRLDDETWAEVAAAQLPGERPSDTVRRLLALALHVGVRMQRIEALLASGGDRAAAAGAPTAPTDADVSADADLRRRLAESIAAFGGRRA